MIVTGAERIFLRGGKTRIHSELIFKKHLLYSFILVYDILINCTFYKSYDIIQTRQSEGPLYEIHA